MSALADEPSGGRVEIRAVAADVVRPLRGRVLRPGAPPADLVYPGDAVTGALHLAAFTADRELVAVGSVAPEPPPGEPHVAGWRVRGMATDDRARGTGLGGRVLGCLVEHARRHGGAVVWCNARLGAIGFYERHGWRTASEEFEIPGLGWHRVARRDL